MTAIGAGTPRSPETRLRTRDQNRAWSEKNRGCTKLRPWLAGPPPFDTHLPGASMAVSFRPLPQWPIELRNTRGLHGALSTLLGVPHAERHPHFSLVPIGTSWAVHWWHEKGRAFAGGSWNGALYDRPTVFTFGPAFRLRAPLIAKRGRQRVRIHTITPVIQLMTDPEAARSSPTTETITASLSGDLLERLGLAYMRERDLVQARVLERRTAPSLTPMGGKYGTVRGWEGSVDLEVNAPARWLLEVVARVGFGTRTAFGFGRVKLEELP